MKPVIGQTLVLNHVEYLIEGLLGGGAVAEAYLATLTAWPGDSVVVKLVRHDQVRRLEEDASGQSPLNGRDKEELLRIIDGLHQEARVLETLNRAEDPVWSTIAGVAPRLSRANETRQTRRIIALLDSGELSHLQPFVVQELAPPMFERFDLKSWQDERRLTAVAHGLAEAMRLAHEHGFALADLDPQRKGDRFRVQWSESGDDSFELKIIDWNATLGREHVSNDLFLLGCHFYYFFLGSHLILDRDEQPPTELGLTSPHWSTLTEGSRHLLQRMLNRDPRLRYHQADRLANDLRWWLEALQAASAPNALERLQDRLWQARREERHDRVVAAADLALRLNPPPEARQHLELRLSDACDRLEGEIWRPISQALATMMTGAYSKAESEFRLLNDTLPAEGEPARRTRIYLNLARAGSMLRLNRQGADVRSDPTWRALNRAAEALVKREWSLARDALAESTQHDPATADWPPVLQLGGLAQSGMLLDEAVRLTAEAEPRRADSGRSDWMRIANEQANVLERAVEKLQSARELAPMEAAIAQQLRIAQDQLALRRKIIDMYGRAQALASQGDECFEQGRAKELNGDTAPAADIYQQAADALKMAEAELQQILELDPGQYHAMELYKRIQPRIHATAEHRDAARHWVDLQRQVHEAKIEARKLLQAGSYEKALILLQEAVATSPDEVDLKDMLDRAAAAARVERQARGQLETARQYLRLRNPDQAEQQAPQPSELDGRQLCDLISEELPIAARQFTFRVNPNLHDELTRLADGLREIKLAREGVARARESGEHEQVIYLFSNLATALRKLGEDLNEEEIGWRDEAQQRLHALRQVEEELEVPAAKTSVVGLMTALRALGDDPGRRAAEVANRGGQALLEFVDQQHALTLFEKLELLGPAKQLPILSRSKLIGQFREWQARIETGLRIERTLAVSGDEPWPAWLAENGADENLRRLAQDLKAFDASDCRPVSAEQVRTWRARAESYLDAYLNCRLAKVRNASQRGDFKLAGSQLQDIKLLVPEEIFPPIWKDLQVLDKALQDRERAGEGIARIIGRLLSSEESFRAVRKAVQEVSHLLPNHPDVPVTDLSGLANDLERAAEMEEAQHKLVEDGQYAPLISRLATGVGQSFGALEQPELPLLAIDNSGMRVRLDELRSRQRQRVETLTVDLVKELLAEAQALLESDNREVDGLLALYTQVLQTLSKRDAVPSIGPHLHQALDEIDTVTRQLAARLRAEIHALDGPECLERAKVHCGRLQKLCEKLQSTPAVVQDLRLSLGAMANEGDLLPIPSTVALNRLLEGVNHLSEQAQRHVDSPVWPSAARPSDHSTPTPIQTQAVREPRWPWQRQQAQAAAARPKAKPASRVAIAASTAPDLRVVIDNLKKLGDTLDSLEGSLAALAKEPPANGGSPLQKLRDEVEAMSSLAEELVTVEKECREEKAGLALSRIAGLRSRAASLAPTGAWLLEPEKSRLQAFLRALDDWLDDRLRAQVSACYSQPSRAVQDLRQMGVGVPLPGSPGPRADGDDQAGPGGQEAATRYATGGAPVLDPDGRSRLAKAIIAATDAEVESALAGHNRGRALEVWGIVREATRGSTEWREMHRLAEERIKVIRPRIPWRAVAVVGGIFSLVICLLAGALGVSFTCRGSNPRPFCAQVPEPVRVALLGTPVPPTSIPSSTHTPTQTPSPTATWTPLPTLPPTPAARVPVDCDILFTSKEGDYTVIADAQIEYTPVIGQENTFSAVWHLKPVTLPKICPDLDSYGYRVNLPEESSAPFQMEGHEFRLTLLPEGLYEASVKFRVLDINHEERGQENLYLYYLTDRKHSELPKSYIRVPVVVLALDWHLLAPVTATPSPSPAPTATPPRPTETTPALTPTSMAGVDTQVPEPSLKNPSEETLVEQWVTFEWDYATTLAEDQWFQVRVRRENKIEAEPHGVAEFKKEKTLNVDLGLLIADRMNWNHWTTFPTAVQPGSELWWSVAVMEWDGKGTQNDNVLIESALWKFVYAGESEGGHDKSDKSPSPPNPPSCTDVNCKACDCSDHCCRSACKKCK